MVGRKKRKTKKTKRGGVHPWAICEKYNEILQTRQTQLENFHTQAKKLAIESKKAMDKGKTELASQKQKLAVSALRLREQVKQLAYRQATNVIQKKNLQKMQKKKCRNC